MDTKTLNTIKFQIADFLVNSKTCERTVKVEISNEFLNYLKIKLKINESRYKSINPRAIKLAEFVRHHSNRGNIILTDLKFKINKTKIVAFQKRVRQLTTKSPLSFSMKLFSFRPMNERVQSIDSLVNYAEAIENPEQTNQAPED